MQKYNEHVSIKSVNHCSKKRFPPQDALSFISTWQLDNENIWRRTAIGAAVTWKNTVELSL